MNGPAVAAPSRRRPILALVAAGILMLPLVLSTPASALRPEAISDVSEEVIDAVVNISTSQRVAARRESAPQVPQGSPFEEFFEEFFKRRGPREGGPGGGGGQQQQPRRVSSLGSGFVIDAAEGLVVTNNHVIADADEITVVFNDKTSLTAEIVGRDQKTDIALLRVKPDRPLKAVKFGDSERLRLGEWVVAIGNPFGLGGTVTAGIVSARNRDINSGPYDNYIQTDASINRGNSGGPLFNLRGEVVGVNTAIISPSGGSIGIGFAVPSQTVTSVIDQLRKYGETRRGWLGVRIQQVTDEIAESLQVKPPRGALVAGVDEKGPAAPAGIEPGDVIVRFDGREIRDMRDLPRIVADTAVGKEVEVVVIRKGQEEIRKVTLGRLEDSEQPQQASATPGDPPSESSVKSALGLDIASLSDELRRRHSIKDGVNGVVITGVDPSSGAAEKQLAVGDVIVEVAQEPVTTAEAVLERIEKLRGEGRRSALLLVANAAGEVRFVALPLQ